MFFRYAAVKKSEVHWIHIRVENHLIEVPHNDRQCRQHRLVKVDCQSYVDGPTRQKSKDAQLEPNHQTRQAHDHRAPYHRPVLSLFSITESGNPWSYSGGSQIIAEITQHILEVFSADGHVFQPQPAFFRNAKICEMVNTGCKHNHRCHSVDYPAQVFTSSQHRSKPGVRILKCKAAQDEGDKARQ